MRKLHFPFLFVLAFIMVSGAANAQHLTGQDLARLYEFNMVKEPVTGKIPAGIRTKELEQARSVLEMQQRNLNNIESYSYLFQGPNNLGGRTRALAYDIRFNGTSNRIILAGGVSGGVFKTIDDAATWIRKSPKDDLFSVSSIAQDPRIGFQDTWYYAGGEWTGNSAGASGALYRGKGVYKSTDNGENWFLLTNSNTGVYENFDHRADYVMKLVVDPTNGNVYMAAIDAIYKSTDGGMTWALVLTSGSGSLSTAFVTDIVVTPTGKFYAAFAGGSPTSPTNMPGVWSSTTGDSGSWTKIAGPTAATNPAGWNAAGSFGRCVLAIAPSLESRVFALYYTSTFTSCTTPFPEAELFRWDNGISTWTELSANLPDEAGCSTGNDPFSVQGGYDLVVNVKPDDPSVVFIGGTNIYRSTSGFTNTAATTRIGGYTGASGYAWDNSSTHPDIHSIVFPPNSSTTMLCGNDGGIQRTTNNLGTPVVWSQINNGYNTYQYYYVDIDPRTGNNKVIGGAQDNGTTRNIGGTGSSYEMVSSGDGVSVGLTDLIGGTTQYEYVGVQNGVIRRRNATSGLLTSTTITPAGTTGGLFVTLFKLDPDNTEFLYYANDDTLFRTGSGSTVNSTGWTRMTGVANAIAGASIDITALATTRGLYNAATSSLFMGTSNGKVFRLDDPTGVAASTIPVNITGGSFPVAFVSSISVNPRNDDTVMVTFSNYGVISAFWTGNANAPIPTWTAVEGNIAIPSFRSSSIAITPLGVQYFVGTSVGLYSVTGLPAITTWTQEGAADFGNAVVSSLALRPSDNKLLVGTHGHGMWTTTIIPLAPLVNDDAPGAILINVGAGPCTGGAPPFTNVGATQSPGEPYPACVGTAGFKTVWYQFIASGNSVKISSDHIGYSMGADSRIALFSASNVNNYATFTSIACDDENGVAVPGKSILYATDLTAGNTYYIQIDGKNNSTTEGTFCITVDDMTSAMLSTLTTCASGQPLTSVNDDYIGWLSSTDGSGNLIALINNPTGSATISTYTNALNINTGPLRSFSASPADLQFYLDRNFLINNPTVFNVNVRVFFLNTELSALQSIDPDVTLSNLQVTRQTGSICDNNFVAANGTNSSLPNMNGITGTGPGFSWIEFTTPGFSKFFLHTKKAFLPVKTYLHGAYSSALARHKDVTPAWAAVLNTFALVQPFSSSPWFFPGPGSVSPGFFTSTASNTDITDWVLLELRDALIPSTVIASRAAFIREDGRIVDLDGISDVSFRNVVDGNYHLVIRHRNHLAIRTATGNARTLNGTLGFTLPALYDFSTSQSQAFQNLAIPGNMAMRDLAPGVYGMWGGNGNGDGFVRATGLTSQNDFLYLLNALGNNPAAVISNVYNRTDLNLDGTVRASGLSGVNDYLFLLSALNFNPGMIVTQHQ